MAYVDIDARQVFGGALHQGSPVIYVIDSSHHPLGIDQLAAGRSSTIVTLPVDNWNDALTPWAAPGLYRDEPDFGGKAPTLLEELLHEAIPTIEATEGLRPAGRALCGYSLGGLFSLYAFTHCSAFDACGCLSGSVWYEGWVNHLAALDLALAGRFAFLSVGTKEKRGGTPLMRTVQSRMEDCARILESCGCEVSYVTGPGNHLQHIPERLDAGLTALDMFLSR